jgi:hypothetical protein
MLTSRTLTSWAVCLLLVGCSRIACQAGPTEEIPQTSANQEASTNGSSGREGRAEEATLVYDSAASSPAAPTPPDDTSAPPSDAGTAPKERPGWTDVASQVAGGVFLGAEKGVVFYGFDVLAEPNQPVNLTARVRKGRTLSDYEHATIAFYQGSTQLGTAKTNDEGFATLKWQPPGIGDYEVTAQIAAVPEDDRDMLQVSFTPILVMIRPSATPFVVIDLDHTLVDSGFMNVLIGGGRPMAYSVEVTEHIAQEYSIIYLTQRPDLMTKTSKVWLKRHGYPVGPLLVSEMKEAIGSSGRYKTARLSTLRKTFPKMKFGIGDKISDAEAYVDNGITAFLIPAYKLKPDAMREKADEIRALDRNRNVQVVKDWRQIEAGIFEGKKYPADAYAQWLDDEAARLATEKHEKIRQKARGED